MDLSILKSKDKIEDIIFYSSLVSLFVYGLTFPLFNLKLLSAMLCTYCFLVAYTRKQLSVDIGFILIFITYLLIAVMDLHKGNDTRIFFVTLLPFGYMFGKLIVPRDKSIRETRLFILIFALALGLFLHGVLDYYMGPLYKMPGASNWSEFWTGKEDVSRNVFDFDFVYMTSLFAIVFFMLKKNKVVAITIVILNIIVEICTFTGGGRYNICMMILTTAAVLLLYFLSNFRNLSKETKKKIYISGIGIIVVIALVFLLVKLNSFGLYDLYSDSYLSRDGGILHNVRFEVIAESMQLMLQEPLGGWKVTAWEKYGAAASYNGLTHSTQFLYAQEYDIIIFALMTITMLLFIKDIILIAIKKNKSIVDYLLCALFFNLNVYIFLDTFPWRYREYWLFALVVSGFVRGKLELEESDKIWQYKAKVTK